MQHPAGYRCRMLAGRGSERAMAWFWSSSPNANNANNAWNVNFDNGNVNNNNKNNNNRVRLVRAGK
ncbi:DUF1566 domain-containing protein [Desulfurivibrio sp. D14AmB]|uniref:Lcl domain-containing protein n=1 Tax=Desulfurivibrio sp. D14AmB TaxID=3374370 RepID=UPI00376EEE6E